MTEARGVLLFIGFRLHFSRSRARGLSAIDFVNELKRRGHSVYAADLINTDRDDYTRADVCNHRQLERQLDSHKFDYVYHLAAEYGRWNGEDYYEDLWQTNCIGTKNLLRL